MTYTATQRDGCQSPKDLFGSFLWPYPRGFLGFPYTCAICPLRGGGHPDTYRRLRTSLWGPILWGSSNTPKAAVAHLSVMS